MPRNSHARTASVNWSPERFARFCARHQVERKHILLAVSLFGRGHPSLTPARLLLDLVQGKGPAVVAAGWAR